jgi:hypothetical protein
MMNYEWVSTVKHADHNPQLPKQSLVFFSGQAALGSSARAN